MSALRVCAVALAGVLLAGSLAGCGAEPGAGAPGTMRVEASFYPLAWMAEQVGGDQVSVATLTKPGAEPHDLELTPSDVAAISDADQVVYLRGFQPAVDAAVREAGEGAAFDVTTAADLDLTFTPIEDGSVRDDQAGAIDPHFWLDPTRLAAVADAFAERLSQIDPEHAADYAANEAALAGRLARLDEEFTAGLADCASTDLVTSHNAFGYLARRYGLTQVGITGLTPDGEPSPAALAEITRFVERKDVGTIFFETLASPDIARTVASEAGARTDVLDPIEGLNDSSQGGDYLEVMAANLANLRRGLSCR